MAEYEAAVYGGHDCKFVDKVPDRFNCQICTKVLRDPHLTVCCGQHFCESCLNKWFDRQQGKQSCPHCRAEGDALNHVINKGLRSEINQLKIRCSYHGDGCQWMGELGALKGHLESKSGCGFVVVECPNKCKSLTLNCGITTIVMQRQRLSDHLKNICYLRPHQCKFCGLKDTYEAITGLGCIPHVHTHDNGYFGHQATCPEVPLTCPNKCGSKDIKRKDMDGHRSKCPREHVECPFAEAGCSSGVLRCQLEDHMTSNVQQHLMIVIKDNKELKINLKETRGALEKKLKETQARLSETELKLNKTQSALEKELKKTQAKLTKTELKLNQMQTQLDETCMELKVMEDPMDMYKLKKSGDSIKFRMTEFSDFCRSGEVWHSPPFYYREGYKMCLTVDTRIVISFDGTHEYFSVSLLLLRGKHYDQLKWPMTFCESGYHYQPPIAPPPPGNWEFCVCSKSHNLPINERELVLAKVKSEVPQVNDCLTFTVKHCGSCHILVCIAV